ncbi:hypothetical protein B0H19DRAFT_1381141 [Mycena capillaripes]|nr:hypothetical protein B0H19DRAFT_1381141 [Mycena capillaripes]
MYSLDPVLAFSFARPALALKPIFRPDVMDFDVDVLIPRKRAHDDILAQSQSVKKMRLTPVFGLKNRVPHSSLVHLRRPRPVRPRRLKVPAPAVDVPLTVAPVTVVITEIIVHLKPALTKTEQKELERWNALCDKRRSDFSAHAPRPGPVTLTIPETKAEYDFRMKWNARCNDGHLSPHATTPSTEATSTVVPTVVPAVPTLANYTVAVPKSEKATGKQRAVDPMAAAFDNDATSTPVGEITNARTSIAFSEGSSIVDPTAIPAVIPAVLHTSAATSALVVPKSEKAQGKQRAVPIAVVFDIGATRMALADLTNGPLTRSSNGGGGNSGSGGSGNMVRRNGHAIPGDDDHRESECSTSATNDPACFISFLHLDLIYLFVRPFSYPSSPHILLPIDRLDLSSRRTIQKKKPKLLDSCTLLLLDVASSSGTILLDSCTPLLLDVDTSSKNKIARFVHAHHYCLTWPAPPAFPPPFLRGSPPRLGSLLSTDGFSLPRPGPTVFTRPLLECGSFHRRALSSPPWFSSPAADRLCTPTRPLLAPLAPASLSLSLA